MRSFVRYHKARAGECRKTMDLSERFALSDPNMIGIVGARP